MTATSTGSGAGNGQQTLQHAFLDLLTPPTAPGSLEPGAQFATIEFQFNPKELTVGKGTKWVRNNNKKNKNCGIPEFRGPEPGKLTLEMFLDASDTHGPRVVEAVEKLFSCCVPTKDSIKNKKPSPPWVRFRWGSMSLFAGYVHSVSVKYTLFTQDGLPIRATATINMEEISKEDEKQNPTSGALAAHRVHTVLTGDTLASIAWHEYGDPGMWRALATFNAIEDPMRLRPGSSLLVPAAEELSGAR
jgi:hypothetical protein